MRLIRPEQSWHVLFPTRGERLCLQRLALRCGYRIDQICAVLECSERYLYEVFSRDIGLPPKEWMRWERMVVARRKLIGGLSSDEVAQSLGFTVKKNFRREFVACYGVSPLEFQHEHWAEVGSRRTEAERRALTFKEGDSAISHSLVMRSA